MTSPTQREAPEKIWLSDAPALHDLTFRDVITRDPSSLGHPCIEYTRSDLLPASVGGGGWRPIETAPKDGRHLLLWTMSECPIVSAHWVEFEGHGYWAFDEALIGEIAGSVEDATHWMPLPTPPGEKS